MHSNHSINSHPEDSSNQPESSASPLQVFKRVTTGLETELFFENMCGADDPSRTNSVMDFFSPNADQQKEIEHEAIRHLAARSYRVILPEHCQQAVTELARYHREIGIAESSHGRNPIFVPDSVNFSRFEELFAHLGTLDLKGHGKSQLLSYMPARLVHELCKTYGIEPSVWQAHAHEAVVQTYSNKSNLRSLVQSILDGSLDDDGYRLPRFTVTQGDTRHEGWRESAATGLKALIEWNARYGSNTDHMLFLQLATGSGGNHPITHDFVIHGYGGQTESLHSVEGILNWIEKHSDTVGLEISPFVSIEEGYSYGVVVSDDRIAWLGPRKQILDSNQSFVGFEYSTLPQHEPTTHASQIYLLKKIAENFAFQGFRGAFGVDFFDYHDPTGTKRSGVAETNMRLDGTTPYTGLFLKIPDWEHTLFTRGAMIGTRPLSLTGTETSIDDVLFIARQLDIPLATRQNPTGLVVLDLPPHFAAGESVSVGICAGDEDTFREWINRVEDHNSEG